MRATLDRPSAPSNIEVARDVRPVMLLTVNVPLEDAAVEFAVDSAVETGAELFICDAVPVAMGGLTTQISRRLAEHDTRKHLDEVARRSRERGVRTTQLVFHNPKPISAALDVIRESGVGLLVFGADRKWMGRWSFRRAARRLRREAACLVWTNE